MTLIAYFFLMQTSSLTVHNQRKTAAFPFKLAYPTV